MSININTLLKGILQGNRRELAKAITLLESTLTESFEIGQKLLESLLPYSGKALRIGITGVPGVGKSTFIEALGLFLIDNGYRVAVLAVDPSSEITGGSIMGDKTRMNELSLHSKAFIRPSPSSGVLGGVARNTREAMIICEAAGYDVIIVETVGVGQSETLVNSMVDLFLLLILPNAGDELQGIKKGILEISDLIVVNKSDGDNELQAKNTQLEYRKAMNFFKSRKFSWKPRILRCSSLEKQGIENIWESAKEFQKILKKSGELEEQREIQASKWMWSQVKEGLLNNFKNKPNIKEKILEFEKAVISGKMLPSFAAKQLLNEWNIQK